jgi:hypothetical protein
MKKIAILTTFFEAASGYSLVSVAETQIKQLLKQGYDPLVLVQRNFEPPEDQNTIWRPEMIDLRKVLPVLDLTSGVHDEFDARADEIEKCLRQTLSQVDVVITHDIILQAFYKEHNEAVRRVAETQPDILWLHWIHSTPTPRKRPRYPDLLRHCPPPGYIIYPNDTDRNIVAATYGLDMQRVVAFRGSHAIDPLDAWPYHPLTRSLAEKTGLYRTEVGMVYPVLLNRGKQPEKVIRLVAGLVEARYDARLLIVDWQSTAPHFQAYIDQLLALAAELGVGDRVHVASRLDDRAEGGVPKQVVTELMDLSNVYVHPSGAETYSLATHEAALRGNLLCLNADLPQTRELFDSAGIYFDFGSERVKRTYEPDEQSFWSQEARRLGRELRNNRALMGQVAARRQWNPEQFWSEFESLFFLPVPAFSRRAEEKRVQQKSLAEATNGRPV